MFSVGSDYILKDTDVPRLVKCLVSNSHIWEVLGLALGLPQSVREQCRRGRSILSLEMILSEWVEGQGLQPASLGQLVKALAGGIVGHGRLARDLISEFNKVLEEEDPPSLPEGNRSHELAAAALGRELRYSFECTLLYCLQVAFNGNNIVSLYWLLKEYQSYHGVSIHLSVKIESLIFGLKL